MPESYFSLSKTEQTELLDTAASQSGRAVHLLEKDVWVVWALETLFTSPLAASLTFKGGTSLSKAYKVIQRFSEDVDLTCDIRHLLSDMNPDSEGVPPTASQAKKWTKAVHARLPEWITNSVIPTINTALSAQGISATMRIYGEDKDSLLLEYPPLHHGTGYVAPYIRLEFGARSTGEPNESLPIHCDLAPWISGVAFPEARARVMKIERTFWEKATAIHVFCRQGRLRGDRFSRHWYDLVQLAATERVITSLSDTRWLEHVAQHKGVFFKEKDQAGAEIDYRACLQGTLSLVPDGEARSALQEDYSRMRQDGILLAQAPEFSMIMEKCADLQAVINTLYGVR